MSSQNEKKEGASFTPGPWSFTPVDSWRCGSTYIAPGIAFSCNTHGLFALSASGWTGGTSNLELLANARLIAAAPDLFDFARDIATNWDHDSDAHKYGTPCRVCEAERVMRLATEGRESNVI